MPASRLRAALPDLIAFAGGLVVAAHFGWRTTDLVWSLWLSSLVVGFAGILWIVTGPLRAALRGTLPGGGAAVAATALGAAFATAFFAVHFGMFHLVHAVFLGVFFPLGIETNMLEPAAATLWLPEVVARYGIWLPVAFVAERAMFRDAPAEGAAAGPGGSLFRPYRNVIRLHLLIFAFAGLHAAGIEGWPVYVLVYAVYFWRGPVPWRRK